MAARLAELASRPLVSAEELGVLTGKKRRSVELYRARDGMPAVRREYKPGKERWEFDPAACIDWMKRKGIEVSTPRGEEAADSSPAPLDPEAAKGGGDLFDAADRARREDRAKVERANLEQATRLMDATSRRQWLALQMAELESMRGKIEMGDPAAADRWANVIKKVLSELRALEQAELDLAEQRGRMVERAKHDRILLDYAATFKGACEGAEPQFAQRAAEMILGDADLIRAATERGTDLQALISREALVRLTGRAARAVLDQLRANLAAEFTRAASLIDGTEKRPTAEGVAA